MLVHLNHSRSQVRLGPLKSVRCYLLAQGLIRHRRLRWSVQLPIFDLLVLLQGFKGLSRVPMAFFNLLFVRVEPDILCLKADRLVVLALLGVIV